MLTKSHIVFAIYTFCLSFHLHALEILPVFQENSLSTNSISAFVQDDIGFLWVGTDNGLEIFDGYSSFKYTSRDNNNFLVGDRIESLHKDPEGDIWVASTSGLFLCKASDKSISNVSNHRIYAFAPFDAKTIWMTTSEGLLLVDKTGHIVLHLQVKNGLSSNRISSIAKDKNGHFWIGTEKGLDLLIFKSESDFQINTVLPDIHVSFLLIDAYDCLWYSSRECLYTVPQEKLKRGTSPPEIVSNKLDVSTIYSTGNEIWVGTKGNGIIRFEKDLNGDLKKEDVLWVDKKNENELRNSITELFEDSYSNIWVGTKDGMYQILREKYSIFRHVKKNQQSGNGLLHHTISALYCDSKNRIWMGTANGLNCFEWIDRPNEAFRINAFQDHSDKENLISNNKIQSLVGINEGTLMYSTKNKLKFFDIQSGRFYSDQSLSDSLTKYQLRFVRSFHNDQKGNLYMAFASGNLAHYDIYSKKLTPVFLHNNDSWDITKDQENNIWVAGGKDGLFLVKHTQEDQFSIQSFPPESFDNYYVVSVFSDHNNQLWIGTSGGLYCLSSDKQVKKIQLPYQDEHGYVEAIVEDSYHTIWVFGIKGIFRIGAMRDMQSIQYYEPGNDDIARLFYVFGRSVNKEGWIFLGGTNGLMYFDPVRVSSNSYNNTPVVSSFRILNKPVESSPEKGFENISSAKEIRLDYNDYLFSFQLSSLYFPDPLKIRYCYKLEGYDKDWVYLPQNNRTITFTNVPSGSYRLLLRASDPSGLWSAATKEIHIRIAQPWWNTWWCWLLYISLCLLVLFLVVRYINANYKFRHQEEINQWKIRFFINLSHSFITPLNLIETPVRNILDNFDKLPGDEMKNTLTTVQKNVKRLHYLISQLIEFRKIDLNKSQLKLSCIDITGFIENIYNTFEDLARTKNIHFRLQLDTNESDILCDPEKIEIILFNLLTNAFKFTPVGGEIIVSCREEKKKNRIWIEVSDTGIGIKEDELRHIFERFRHSPTDINDQRSGQGIGLSLAKEFVEMHASTLTAKSIPGMGSVFSFYLLLGDKHFAGHPVFSQADIEPHYTKMNLNMEQAEWYQQNDSNIHLPLVFLLDRDEEFSRFVQYSLKDDFQLRLFHDPKSLHSDLSKQYPSLIIADLISIERQEGLLLCREIKSESSTAFIPVILTAGMTAGDMKAAAYEAGANAFIVKPYELSYLKIRIGQLLQSQAQVKERIKQELIVNPKEIKITSSQDIFLANLMDKIEENISNEQYAVDDLANDLNVSRSMLYRKIRTVSGMSPADFIKDIRLKRAAQLLSTESFTVAEVSYQVGFSDTTYFSTCFKKQFGIPPKAYSLQKIKKRSGLDPD